MGLMITPGGRLYDTTTGRFLSRDPHARQGQNAYVALANNPVGVVDPSGLDLVVPARNKSTMEKFFGKNNVTFEKLIEECTLPDSACPSCPYRVKVSDEGWNHLADYVKDKPPLAKRFARQLKIAVTELKFDVPLEKVHKVTLDRRPPPNILAPPKPSADELRRAEERARMRPVEAAMRRATGLAWEKKRQTEERQRLIQDALEVFAGAAMAPWVTVADFFNSLMEKGRRKTRERGR